MPDCASLLHGSYDERGWHTFWDIGKVHRICRQSAYEEKRQHDLSGLGDIGDIEAGEAHMTLEQQFDAFWQAFPKRIGRIAAFKQYQCAVYYQNAQHDAIMKGVEAYKKHLIQNDTEFQFIAAPQRWLSDGRWEDEYEANLPKQEFLSPQNAQQQARVNGYHKTGFWMEAWGEKPKLSLVS